MGYKARDGKAVGLLYPNFSMVGIIPLKIKVIAFSALVLLTAVSQNI